MFTRSNLIDENLVYKSRLTSLEQDCDRIFIQPWLQQDCD